MEKQIVEERHQKYKADYTDTKFKVKGEFEDWLQKTTRYKIHFKDKGQDCLLWWVDKGGEVLHANLQSTVWNGKLVDLFNLVVGEGIGIMDVERRGTLFTDFIVEKIEQCNIEK